MKKLLPYLLAAFVCFTFINTQAQVTTLYSPSWNPESITSDGRYLYVTNIGATLDPLAKDGDGEVRKFSLSGKLIETNISNVRLNAPKGIVIVKGTAYVADLDHLIGLHLASGNKTADIDFSLFHTQFINDVAVKNDTVLFVTATDLNKIFQVTLGKRTVIKPLAIPEIAGANGIYYDGLTKRLYVAALGSFTAAAGEGELGYIEWKADNPVYHKLTGINGFFDGIAVVDENTLIVSDWVNLTKPEGSIRKINSSSGTATVLTTEALAGPADFYFEKKTGRLIIPLMQEGKIVQVKLPK